MLSGAQTLFPASGRAEMLRLAAERATGPSWLTEFAWPVSGPDCALRLLSAVAGD
jgi:hypothetical protein